MIYGQGGTTTGYNTHYTGTNGCFSMLLASTRPTNKLLALQKDVFDISKVTVVGSPTITSDGIASGFSNSDYLKTFPVVALKDKSWTIKTKWLYKDFVTNYNTDTLFDFQNWLAWGSICVSTSSSTKAIIWANCRTGTAEDANNEKTWGRKELNYIPTYVIASMSFDIGTGTYTCKADWGEGEQVLGTYTPTTENKQLWVINTATTQMIRIGTGTDNCYIKNAVSLTDFSIIADGQLVYSPTKPTYLLERRKPTVWNKGQFTVVGSPTITSDGVASGFSANNCLLVNLDNPITNNNTQLKVLSKAVIGEKAGRSIVLFHSDKTGGISSGFTVQIGDVYDRIWMNGYGYMPITYNFQVGDIIEVEAIWDFQSFSETLNVLVNGQTKLTNTVTFTSAEFSVDRFSISGTTPNGGYAWSGSIDLKQFKIYTEEGYDSNFTILGSPTITSDGIASGFSSSNYLKTNYILPLSTSNTWKIRCYNTISGTTTSVPFEITDSSNRQLLRIQGNKVSQLLVLNYLGSSTSSQQTSTISNLSLQDNLMYCFEVEFTGSAYVFKIYDTNNSLIGQTTYSSSNKIHFDGFIRIGYSVSTIINAGSNNLKQFKIYANNKLVFDGEPKDKLAFDGGANTYVYDPSKFELVGTPTITEDGIASGFTTANYIEKKGLLPTSGTHDYVFKLRYKHITNDFSTTGYTFNVRLTSAPYFSVATRTQTKTLSFIESTTGVASIHDVVALVEGKIYDIEVQTDLATYYKGYIDGVEYVNKSLSNAVNFRDDYMLIGICAGPQMPLTMGELDLKYLSVMVDGEEILTGAKVGYHMLRR